MEEKFLGAAFCKRRHLSKLFEKSFTKNFFTIYHSLQGQAVIFGRNLLPEKNGRVI
ncbi:hypothetical protein [Komagataeibacter swingsii]|uniref:Uncharacterized protein n=1 Tax=Komagataeibacter swingsii TaxID=215220 RepID=A0A850P0C1_9PROT|nr:hypothetical protein [Komagataeibacter swingsii]NVN36964.1 hypothetical protein [Komagataeibacter swingsii]